MNYYKTECLVLIKTRMNDESKNKKNPKRYALSPNTYKWTYFAMKTLFKVFSLTIRTHGKESSWLEGDIFLFNHFARFETFIPQYLIYEKTKHFSRTIAAKELFSGHFFSPFLIKLGGIPNNTDALLYRVARDILHQHKLIAFPEGGIVKDRQILDKKGRYRIYSRSHKTRRKLHTGPAVIALAIAIFKQTVRDLHQQGDDDVLSLWAADLGFSSTATLIELCNKPTAIIPCNITFYPLRVSNNALHSLAQFFMDNLHRRFSEELLIEGNFLLKDTDMDICLGEPIIVEDYWTRMESSLTTAFIKNSDLALKQILSNVDQEGEWSHFLFRLSYQRNTNKIRDDYMHAIYDNVTINIAHIASTLILHFVDEGRTHIKKRTLHHLIYIAIKALQKHRSLNFHRTLKNPSIYRNLLMAKSKTFDRFLKSAHKAKLIESSGAYYQFSKNLVNEHDFDSIRYKNPIVVNANEVSSIPEVETSIKNSLAFQFNKESNHFADLLIEDELLEYHWDIEQFKGEKHQTLNQQQMLSEDSALPYVLKPAHHNGECIIFIHGLLSTPAELRELAEKFANEGFIAIGCRLKGHGTSPWDLHERTWQDWRQSVQQSIKIAHCYSQNVHLVGFSGGGLLALLTAADRHINIASVVACLTPIFFKDPSFKRLKITDTANKIIKKFSGSEGLLVFKKNIPEHPHINYQHIPVSAVHQLIMLIDQTTCRLNNINCPVLLIQGDNDPVVDSSSFAHIARKIPKERLSYQWVSSDRHGILFENTGMSQQKIIRFITKQAK